MDEVKNKEFNYSKYQDSIVEELTSRFGSKEKAIVALNAQITDLEVTVDALRELVDWDALDEELDDEMEML